jgi:hypothetical protein
MNFHSSKDPFEAYKTYIAVKLHFESKSYDYFKYNGKSSVTQKSFFARRDKFFFAKVSKRYTAEELPYFFACNFAHHGTKWIGSLADERSDETYKEFKGLMESFTYRFKNDINKILSESDFKSLFVIDEGQYPMLLRYVMQKDISIETFIIMNRFLNFMPKFDNEIKDPILWPDQSLLIRKYDKFITVNNNKAAEALKDCLQSNVSVV